MVAPGKHDHDRPGSGRARCLPFYPFAPAAIGVTGVGVAAALPALAWLLTHALTDPSCGNVENVRPAPTSR